MLLGQTSKQLHATKSTHSVFNRARKLIPALLILALPGTCLLDEDATDNTPAAYMPKDSLEHWVLRDPPHAVDLLMLLVPDSGGPVGRRAWDQVMDPRVPIRWSRREFQLMWTRSPRNVWGEGSTTMYLPPLGAHTGNERIGIAASGDTAGVVRFGIGPESDDDIAEIRFSLFSEIDSARIREVDRCMDAGGMDGHVTNEVRLPGKHPFWVRWSISCGMEFCTRGTLVSFVPIVEEYPCAYGHDGVPIAR